MNETHVYFDRYFAKYISARPFEGHHWDESFDLIICDNSYQCFKDFEALADEIYRLLKTSGFCYFAGHTHAGSSPTDKDNAAKYFRTKRILRKKLNNFWIHDYMPLIKENPAAFKRDLPPSSVRKGDMSGVFKKMLAPFGDEFVWVLTKKK